MTDPNVTALAQAIVSSDEVVVLTGAGMSTESGVPDFRSPGGVWQKYEPVYYDEFLNSADARTRYWHQKCESHQTMGPSAPNVGHRLLADWERQGRIRGVVTQNIDGLHSLAGSENTIELHGNARQVACLDCSFESPAEPFVETFLDTRQAPDCPACGGRLKHATISFGQPLDVAVLRSAIQWSRTCNLMIVLGSSLLVTPAADLPREAKQCGATVAIVNNEPTPLDALADLVIRDAIGKTLEKIDKHIRGVLN